MTGPTRTMNVAAADSEPVSELARVRLAKGEVVPGTPYRIEEWIAEGGMGAVYRARHVDIERVVALKVLHGAGGDGEAIEQLREEARVTAGIEAPNIVEVYDFLRIPDGRVAMAMEMLEGQTLREVLQASAPLAPGRVVAILRQICRGLAAAHEAGLVHLDIKPENIMLIVHQGRRDFVKVLDFGIAGALGEVGREDVVGTAAYVAPERLEEGPIDGRTDFYSLGCVAYEMLVGAVPFRGDLMKVMEHHIETPPPSPLAANDGVPAALDALIVKCMAKDPAGRPRDAADLEAALCEAQIAAGLQTDWDDLPLPPVDDERRDALLRNMPQLERPRPRSSRRAWWAAATLGVLVAVGSGLALRGGEARSGATALDERLDELTTRAYAAAAKTFYLYPAPDAPEADTAYTVLIDLDALEAERPAARERAAMLRGEFADALVRLGDRYWDEPGGRPFAMDYYAQALMFDADRERASERAGLSVGQINDLRRKAQERAFTAADLRSVEPLVALALDDPAQRDEALERLSGQPERSPRVRDDLARLVERRPRARSTTPAKPDAAPASGAEAGAESPEDTAAGSGGEPGAGGEPGVRTLIDRAKAKARAGRTAQAQKLFNRALKIDPRNLEALVGLGDLHFEAGHYTEAARHRRAATRRAPNNARLRIGLGDALFKTFRYADAMTQYKRAAKLGHPAAADRIARLNEKLGNR